MIPYRILLIILCISGITNKTIQKEEIKISKNEEGGEFKSEGVEIVITQLDFNEARCVKMDENYFEFLLDYESSYKGVIDKFDIDFSGPKGPLIKAQCENNLTLAYNNHLHCKTNDKITIMGDYYPSTTKDIQVTKSYYIKQFSLEKDGFSFTTKNYNPVISKEGQGNIYNIFYKTDLPSEVSSVNIEFKNKFEDGSTSYDYPTVKLGDRTLLCTSKDNILKCDVKKSDFPMNTNYTGSVTNVCNKKEVLFSSSTYKKYIINYEGVDFKQLKCSKLMEYTKFYIKRNGMDDPSYPTFSYSYINKFKLVKKDNPSISNYLKCEPAKTQVICSIIKSLGENGEYTLKLEEAIEENEFIFNQFESKEIFHYNKEYNQIDASWDSETIHHGYDESKKGEIQLTYLDPVEKFPQIKYKGVITTFEMEKDEYEENEIKIFFDESKFPYDKSNPTKFVNYTIEILNACGSTDYTVSILVNFEKTVIDVTKTIYKGNDDKCLLMNIDTPFLFETTSKKGITNRIDFNNLFFLKNVEQPLKMFKLGCYLDSSRFQCEVKEVPTVSGNFKVVLLEKYETEGLVINKFTSNETFPFHVDEIKLIEGKDPSFTFDYKDGLKSTFKFYYLSNIKTKPKVYLAKNEKEFNCIKEGTTLICDITPEITPWNYNDPDTPISYKIILNNLCGTEEYSFFGKVLKSGEFKRQKVTITYASSMKSCTSFLNGGKVDLKLGDTESFVEKPFTTEDIFLENITGGKTYRIKLSCTLIKELSSCDLKSNPTQEGKYKLRLLQDVIIDDKTYLEEINLETDIYYVKYDQDPYYEKMETWKYDYSKGSIGKFLIPYHQEIKIVPKVYKENPTEEVTCRIYKKNNLRCDITQDIFPTNKGGEGKSYNINVNNICGGFVFTRPLTVNGTSTSVEIRIVNENFDNLKKCNTYSKNFIMNINYEYNYGLSGEITNNEIALIKYEDMEQKISFSCKDNRSSKKLECKSTDDMLLSEGSFHLYIPSYSNSIYSMKEYISNQNISFTENNYIEPQKEKYEIMVDYSQKDISIFNIEFKEDLGTSKQLPKVYIKSRQEYLSCSKEANKGNSLSCTVEKNKFPINPTNPEKHITYDLELINVCNGIDARIILEVFESGKSKEKSSSESKEEEKEKGGSENKNEKNHTVIIVLISVFSAIIFISVIVFIIIKRQKRNNGEIDKLSGILDQNNEY